jgi:H/ACA ribonucleoprotein complex non-core subunit NAF1
MLRETSSAVEPPKTRNEEPDPILPKPEIDITPSTPITLLGKVENVVANRILVKATTTGDYRVVEIGSALCLEDRTIIGQVADLIGQVSEPRYIVGFINEAEIANFGIIPDTTVYYVNEHSTFVFTQELRAKKWADTSGQYDEEVEDEVFSDDEKEAEYKRMLKYNKQVAVAARHGRPLPKHPEEQARERSERGRGRGRGRGRVRGRGNGRGDYHHSPSAFADSNFQAPLKLKYEDNDDEDMYKPLARPDNLHQMVPPPPHSHAPNKNGRGRGDRRGGRDRGNDRHRGGRQYRGSPDDSYAHQNNQTRRGSSDHGFNHQGYSSHGGMPNGSQPPSSSNVSMPGGTLPQFPTGFTGQTNSYPPLINGLASMPPMMNGVPAMPAFPAMQNAFIAPNGFPMLPNGIPAPSIPPIGNTSRPASSNESRVTNPPFPGIFVPLPGPAANGTQPPQLDMVQALAAFERIKNQVMSQSPQGFAQSTGPFLPPPPPPPPFSGSPSSGVSQFSGPPSSANLAPQINASRDPRLNRQQTQHTTATPQRSGYTPGSDFNQNQPHQSPPANSQLEELLRSINESGKR